MPNSFSSNRFDKRKEKKTLIYQDLFNLFSCCLNLGLNKNVRFTLWVCNIIDYCITLICIQNSWYYDHQIFDCGKSFHIEHKVHVLSIRSNVRSTGRTMNKQLVLVSFPLKMLRKRSMRVTSIGRSQSLIGRYLLSLHHYFHAI